MKKHKLRKLLCSLCAAAMILSSMTVPAGSGSLEVHAASVPKDVANHWAKPFITTAIDKGIVSGYDDGTFRPDTPVSRVEFSHMLNSALGNTAAASISFSDVKSTSWYYSAVQKAVAAGYASGYDNGTFKPTASITRQEAAVMLSRVVPTYNTSASLTKFKDASSVASWATDAMSRAVGSGYIGGTGTGTNVKLDPRGKLTRAQAVVIICKLLENETIIKSTTSVSSATTLKDAIYSNGITVPSNSKSDITINNCIVLGTLNASGSGTVTITNSRVADAQLKGDGGSLIAKGETSIKNTTVSGDGSLGTTSVAGTTMYNAGFEHVSVAKNGAADLTGTFADVTINGSDASLALSGAKVTALSVGSAATNSTVSVGSDSTVTKATVSGPNASFKGTGTVSVMAANANGITYEKRPSTLTTGKEVTKAPALVDAKLTITANPKNGASDVATSTKITLTFSEAIKAYDGSTIGSSDVDDLLELRKNSASGSEIDFDGTINSAKTQITIIPDQDLDADTKYYITMAQKRIKTADGETNETFTSYFTTAAEDDEDGDIVFYPKDGAKDVDVDETLTITFPEKVINYDGSTVSSSDLDDIVILRQTNSKGDSVDFDATINSAKTKITITPEDDLEGDTKYYLAIASKSLKYSSSREVVESISVTWTTEDDDGSFVTFSPKYKATDVKSSVNPTITFDEAIVNYSGSSVTSSYIEDHVELREGSSSGTLISFDGSINSSKTKITIEPVSNLKAGTRYYLSFDSKSFRKKSDETKIPSESIYFTVAGSATSMSISGTSSTDTSLSATVYGTVKGTIYAVLLPSGSSKPSAAQIKEGQNSSGVTVDASRRVNTGTLSANTEKRLTFTGLDSNTSYALYAVLYPSSGSASDVVSKTVSTAKPSIPAALLSSITLSTGSLSFSSTKTSYDVSLPNGTENVTVTAEASDGGNISFDGSNTSVAGSNSKTIDVSSGKASTTITVFDSEKTETTYKINFTVSSNTNLETLTVNGANVKSSMSYTLSSSDGTTARIYIETTDPQAEITGGMTDTHIREADVTVDYGQTEQYSFTVVSTNNAKKDYTITLTNPNPAPQ
ncbi:MAG: S-layer homology domain-containing protein [Firmicutes bacterium]|nr:S-layer homology domain-containing protein [Bacillota bacterium]